MLADSHCHLDCIADAELSRAIIAARAKGVKYILCPGISFESFPKVLNIVEGDDDLFAAVGVHPEEEEVHQPSLEELLTLGQHKKVVAVGETGLDFFHGNSELQQARQIALFKLHIQAAKELNKPLIIHSRDAAVEMLKILTAENVGEIGGVMHCFTGDLAMAQELIALGFYISFSGIITFKKTERLHEVIKNIPLEKILIETDSPYLAPVPMRGKPNEPAYLPYIATFAANLLGMSCEAFANRATENFLRFCRP